MRHHGQLLGLIRVLCPEVRTRSTEPAESLRTGSRNRLGLILHLSNGIGRNVELGGTGLCALSGDGSRDFVTQLALLSSAESAGRGFVGVVALFVGVNKFGGVWGLLIACGYRIGPLSGGGGDSVVLNPVYGGVDIAA